MKTFKAEGLVIKRCNYGESDRIITIFLNRGGKIVAKAPGTRKITSRRASHIELLNHSNFVFYSGKNMPLIIEAQTIDSFYLVKNDLKKIGLSYHICEVVDGLCGENQDNPEVFYLIKQAFRQLGTSRDIEEIVRNFDLNILKNLGFFRPENSAENLNTSLFIEQVLERKLKSQEVNSKLAF